MCGSATLAMVVSSEFITVAVITDSTMNGRAEPTPAGSSWVTEAAAFTRRLAEHSRASPRSPVVQAVAEQGALVGGVHRYLGAEASG